MSAFTFYSWWLIGMLYRNRILLLVGTIALSCFTTSVFNPIFGSKKKFGGNLENQKLFNNSEEFCEFPVFDPFDATILKFVQHPAPLKCPKILPDLIFEKFGELFIDKKLLQKFGNIQLFYREMILNPENIENLHFSEWKKMPDRLKIRGNVEIFGGPITFENVLRNYSMVFPFIPTEKKSGNLREKKSGIEKKQKFNVLLFGLDSVSKPNFIRNLPKTYQFLTEKLGAIVLQKYNKIGDNTYCISRKFSFEIYKGLEALQNLPILI